MVQDPGPALGNIQGFRQQFIDIQHLDAAGAHQAGEHIVVLLGLFDPEHIIKQQRIAVGRGQPSMGKPGATDNHLAQGAGFGMHAQCWFSHGSVLLCPVH